ncbi:MAG: LptA/OstA family protein [Pseudomonadota bacterium]
MANLHSSLTLLALLLVATGSHAQSAALDRRLPIDIDSDQSTLDLASGMMMHRNLRITQGATRIEAERAESSANRTFADSEWQFSGNVRIDVGETRIRAEKAVLRFVNNQLINAKVDGDPAQFSDIDERNGQTIEGAARNFDYDLERNTVRFENDARLRNADSEVSGRLLVYNVTDKQIVFEGDETNGERVRITVQPPTEPEGPDTQPDGNTDTENGTDE